jgi:hypothetical protein
MAETVYFLCTIASFLCALLLYGKYRRNEVGLLFWTALCFLGFAINNLMLMIDLLVLPSLDLAVLRLLPAAFGVSAAIYGFVRDAS